MSESNGMVTIQVPTRITDPETLALLGQQLVASITEPPIERELPIAPVEPELPAKPQQPQIRLPHASTMARAWLWLIAQASTPFRFKRAVLWSLRLPLRAWSLVRVLSSKRVSRVVKLERDDVCSACPSRVYRMRRTKRGVVLDEHCGKCGCPDWRLSRNSVRNWYNGWKCPERRHAGKYPDDDLRECLEANGYDPKTVFGGGCAGCGCGGNKAR